MKEHCRRFVMVGRNRIYVFLLNNEISTIFTQDNILLFFMISKDKKKQSQPLPMHIEITLTYILDLVSTSI